MADQTPPKPPRKGGPRRIPVSDLALLIARGEASNTEIALILGVDRKVVGRWTRHPSVVRAVERIQRRAAEQAGRALGSLAVDATAQLGALMHDPATPAAVRLGAARTVLEFTRKITTTIEHTGQIDLSALPEADFRRRAEEIQRELAAELAKPVTGEA